jgi:Co/Zn/Cd efflux system component
MLADGNHARIDGFVSLGVIASAVVVGLGVQIADPIIGLTITLVILKITWDSWRTVRSATVDLEYIDGHGERDRQHDHVGADEREETDAHERELAQRR